jgi:sensor histidine kinase regulating citrate/malate metabolism
MKHEECWKTSDTSPQAERQHMAGDYVWATSEKTRFRTVSLYLIRSIVEKHGGTIEVGLATDTITIDVPEGERAECAQEIQAQLGTMCL